MDPIVTSVVIILGKYTLDKGVELSKAVGPKALDTAREMFSLVLDKLNRKPEGKFVVGQFEQDPETYQKPLEKTLNEALEADPDLAAQLKTLLDQYTAAAKAHQNKGGVQATLSGSGAIAQGDRAVAAGEGGVAIGGNVEGGIHLGQGSEEPEDQDKPDSA